MSSFTKPFTGKKFIRQDTDVVSWGIFRTKDVRGVASPVTTEAQPLYTFLNTDKSSCQEQLYSLNLEAQKKFDAQKHYFFLVGDPKELFTCDISYIDNYIEMVKKNEDDYSYSDQFGQCDFYPEEIEQLNCLYALTGLNEDFHELMNRTEILSFTDEDNLYIRVRSSDSKEIKLFRKKLETIFNLVDKSKKIKVVKE